MMNFNMKTRTHPDTTGFQATMKPKALDCCRHYSFGDGGDGATGRGKLQLLQQSRAFGFILGSDRNHET